MVMLAAILLKRSTILMKYQHFYEVRISSIDMTTTTFSTKEIPINFDFFHIYSCKSSSTVI